MDWFSRYVLSWAVSITMDVGFCLDALEQALEVARPDIFNLTFRTLCSGSMMIFEECALAKRGMVL